MTAGRDTTASSEPAPSPASAPIAPAPPVAIRQILLFALAVSLCVHMALLLVLARVTWGAAGTGGRGEGRLEIPISLAAESELTSMDRVGLDAPSAAIQEVAEPNLPAIADEGGPGVAEALGGLSPSELGEVGGAGDLTIAGGGGGDDGGAGGVSARFFGVEARGSRFAYVVDVSGSMEGVRLAAMKVALIESIKALLDNAQFSIVFFSSDAISLTGSKWVPAVEKAKRDAEREISAARAFGGTNPLPAFEVIFAMRPRPDAVYFMTDGQFAQGEEDKFLARLAHLNDTGDRRTPIHCITFVERSAEPLMRRIARQSGGSYTHVEGSAP